MLIKKRAFLWKGHPPYTCKEVEKKGRGERPAGSSSKPLNVLCAFSPSGPYLHLSPTITFRKRQPAKQAYGNIAKMQRAPILAAALTSPQIRRLLQKRNVGNPKAPREIRPRSANHRLTEPINYRLYISPYENRRRFAPHFL